MTLGRFLPDHPEYLRIRITYPTAVEAAGGVPVLFPPYADPASLERALSLVDGVLLPGGLDVESWHFGEESHPTVESDPLLDGLELPLARAVAERGVPTLAICRGQQVLNVALGGTLVQDLPSAGTQGHRQREPRGALTHAVRAEPASRLAAALGAAELEVNSFHHQAIRDLAPGLQPVAWAPDGVIEGVEMPNHPWLLAVQFHPEDLVGHHAPSQRLFSAFVQACAERMERRNGGG